MLLMHGREDGPLLGEEPEEPPNEELEEREGESGDRDIPEGEPTGLAGDLEPA